MLGTVVGGAPDAALATWIISAVATAGVILRPWRLPEAIWAAAGAVLLVCLGLLPARDALHAVGEGGDVTLFLSGMMLLSEVARRERLFDWLAAWAARHASGSGRRLFLLVYAVGTVVTTFLSNDATAVVLTPAVFAAARAAGADPLPYLFGCALVANAASFVLPISNPANLVLYASRMPPLGQWLSRFAIPSALSVGTTLLVLLLVERRALRAPIRTEIGQPALPAGGIAAGVGIGITATLLVLASGLGWRLGWPTAAAGIGTAALVLLAKREGPGPMLREVSWGVLPLVAGLFVLVAGLAHTGVIGWLSAILRREAAVSATGTGGAAGVALALACNVMNNLPAGLVAGSTVQAARPPSAVVDSLLVGVDLGPNLSITGSLATILWLAALRREGLEVTFGQFLRRGILVMPPALLLALAGLLLP